MSSYDKRDGSGKAVDSATTFALILIYLIELQCLIHRVGYSVGPGTDLLVIRAAVIRNDNVLLPCHNERHCMP